MYRSCIDYIVICFFFLKIRRLLRGGTSQQFPLTALRLWPEPVCGCVWDSIIHGSTNFEGLQEITVRTHSFDDAFTPRNMTFSVRNIVYGEQNRTSDYNALDRDEIEQKNGLLEDEGAHAELHRKVRKDSIYTRIGNYSLPISALFFILSSISLIIALNRRPTVQQCVAQTSLWCMSHLNQRG
jgi:hypothetical protein